MIPLKLYQAIFTSGRSKRSPGGDYHIVAHSEKLSPVIERLEILASRWTETPNDSFSLHFAPIDNYRIFALSRQNGKDHIGRPRGYVHILLLDKEDMLKNNLTFFSLLPTLEELVLTNKDFVDFGDKKLPTIELSLDKSSTAKLEDEFFTALQLCEEVDINLFQILTQMTMASFQNNKIVLVGTDKTVHLIARITNLWHYSLPPKIRIQSFLSTYSKHPFLNFEYALSVMGTNLSIVSNQPAKPYHLSTIHLMPNDKNNQIEAFKSFEQLMWSDYFSNNTQKIIKRVIRMYFLRLKNYGLIINKLQETIPKSNSVKQNALKEDIILLERDLTKMVDVLIDLGIISPGIGVQQLLDNLESIKADFEKTNNIEASRKMQLVKQGLKNILNSLAEQLDRG